MRRDAFFAGTTVFAAALALLFWNQLRESNKLTAKLQQQVEALTGARNGNQVRPTATEVAPQSAVASVSAQAPPVAQAVAGDANPIAPTPQSKCEASLVVAKKASAYRMAEWAVEFHLAPDEAQRLSEIRQAQTVARSSCASAGGSSADQEQLHAQFLAVLGPAHLEQLVELNASRDTKGGMSYWTQRFKEKDAPLNDEQARQLATILLEENRRYERETALAFVPDDSRAVLADQERQLKLAEERAGRTQAAAQSFLSPDQLAQLRDSVTTQNDQKRSSVKMFREIAERGEKTNYQPPLISIVPAR